MFFVTLRSQEKESRLMATILLTGVTGAVGQTLVPVLKKRGHRLICLVRGVDPEERIAQLFQDVIEEGDVVVNGDVTMPSAGVDQSFIISFRGKVDHMIHLAGSTSMDLEEREETHRTNVGGTENALRLAGALRVSFFHHMSTAYVAGDALHLLESESEIGKRRVFRNPYEESKAEAEKLVQAYRGRWRIYRMSIMIGDSRSGKIGGFSGYYGYFRHFWLAKQILAKSVGSLRAKDGSNDICFTSRGALLLPVVVQCGKYTRLNLITSDWLSRVMADLVESNDDRYRVFHLVHPWPPSVENVIRDSLYCMGIGGVRFSYKAKPGPDNGSLLSTWQRRTASRLALFDPYVTGRLQLGYHNVMQVLGSDLSWMDPILPPVISKQLYRKCLMFAGQCGFSARRAVEVTQ